MSKRILKPLIIVLVVICVIACIPGVYSYMVHRTAPITNIFERANVDCTVHDVFNGTTKKLVTVTNDSNVEAYVRVRVVSYWVDSKGGVIAKESPTVTINYNNDWVYDAVDQTYYYKYPLAPDASTPDLLNGGTLTLSSYSNQDDNQGNNQSGTQNNEVVFTYHQVVEFVAEAIQSNPTKAVTESWNVMIKMVDGKNVITGITSN